MPELPDVEVFRQYMDKKALHHPIRGVVITAEEILEAVTAQELRSRVEGQEFHSTSRHGKHLFVKLRQQGCLVFHFGMTGRVRYFRGRKTPQNSRAIFHFTNGYSLALLLQRKLGKLALVDDVSLYVEEHNLGPDALEGRLSQSGFRAALRSTRSTIKSALMNQALLAGIGSIYSDEILFQARLHPKAKASEFSDEVMDRLFQTIKDVLQTAIDSGADPEKMPGHFLIPQREASCPFCGSSIKKIKVSGRSSYICPRCQMTGSVS